MKGFISAQKINKANLIGEDGFPIYENVIDWSDLVPCSYVYNEFDNKGAYANGEFVKTSFTITTTEFDFDAKMIRLYDSNKALVCEKEVVSLERLGAVRRVKIKL